MNNVIPIIKENITFSPFHFYSNFLRDVAQFYSHKTEEVIQFKLMEDKAIVTG